ncbi:MAG TPA: isochorismatase family protein [Polyangia bacterium]|nr:isochorismatase family protein [Polyangia bacterium]
MKHAAASALVIDAADAGLVLIDVQTKLASAMPQPVLERSLRNWLALVEMAARLKMPVAVSEQYPQGLGRTIPALREMVDKVMPPARFLEKLDFSCCEAPLFDQFLGGGRKTWIVCGMEAHICVYQTVRGLLERGFQVHVPIDGIMSRSKSNWRVGVSLMDRAGAVMTSTETVLFDLLKRAQGPEWRALSKLIK